MIFYHPEEFIQYVNSLDDSIIGVTSGCYDLLHPLHVEYLNKCKRECPRLFVFIDSDRLVNIQKNKTPFIDEMYRAYMVDNVKAVDGVMVFNELIEMSDCIRLISDKFNRWIKVFKHNDTIYGSKLMTYGNNVENVIIPDVVRLQSTTEIINYLKQTNNEKSKE